MNKFYHWVSRKNCQKSPLKRFPEITSQNFSPRHPCKAIAPKRLCFKCIPLVEAGPERFDEVTPITSLHYFVIQRGCTQAVPRTTLCSFVALQWLHTPLYSTTLCYNLYTQNVVWQGMRKACSIFSLQKIAQTTCVTKLARRPWQHSFIRQRLHKGYPSNSNLAQSTVQHYFCTTKFAQSSSSATLYFPEVFLMKSSGNSSQRLR